MGFVGSRASTSQSGPLQRAPRGVRAPERRLLAGFCSRTMPWLLRLVMLPRGAAPPPRLPRSPGCPSRGAEGPSESTSAGRPTPEAACGHPGLQGQLELRALGPSTAPLPCGPGRGQPVLPGLLGQGRADPDHPSPPGPQPLPGPLRLQQQKPLRSPARQRGRAGCGLLWGGGRTSPH